MYHSLSSRSLRVVYTNVWWDKKKRRDKKKKTIYLRPTPISGSHSQLLTLTEPWISLSIAVDLEIKRGKKTAAADKASLITRKEIEQKKALSISDSLSLQ